MLETLSFESVTLTYNLLFDLDVAGQSRPMLAAEVPTQENGGVSADGKTVTVKLRPDLKWSDGKPLTAEDVAWTYNYYVDNGDVLPNMSLGAMGIERTVAVDATTVRIECVGAESGPLLLVPADPARSTSGRRCRRRRRGRTYRNTPPLVGSGPFLVAGVEAGLVHAS